MSVKSIAPQIVSCHVIHGRPQFLFSSGIQCSQCLFCSSGVVHALLLYTNLQAKFLKLRRLKSLNAAAASHIVTSRQSVIFFTSQSHFFTWLTPGTTLTAYIFGAKHDIDNWSSALTTKRGLLHRLKMSWTLVHKQRKTRRAFLPTLRKSCILIYCQALQTEISKRNSTKLCQVHIMGSKSLQQTSVEKLEPSLPQKLGAKKLLHLLQDFVAIIFWTKCDTDNRKRALESTRGFLHHLKISWTFVHKWLKIGLEFSASLRKFCIVLPTRKPNLTKRCHTGGNKWRWCEPNKVAPHSECKCNHWSLVSEAPKTF